MKKHVLTILILVILIFGFSCTGADGKLPFDKSIIKGRLDNGMTYILRENKKPEKRIVLYLVCKAGSVLEEDNQRGLAHFVEHMAFNGTEKFQKHEIISYLESLGMEFGPEVNAHTSFDETIYKLQVPSDNPEALSKALEILQQWAAYVQFQPEEVEKEALVIEEEWRQSRGAYQHVSDLFRTYRYYQSRYAKRAPIGSMEVVRGTTQQGLRDFYSQWYQPPFMALVVVGDTDIKKLERQLPKFFTDLPQRDEGTELPWYPVPEHEEFLVVTATDPELRGGQINYYLKYPARIERTIAEYREGIIDHLFYNIFSKRLEEISLDPEAPFISAYSGYGKLCRTAEARIINMEVKQGRYKEALGRAFREVERINQHGLSEGEIQRAKKELLSRMKELYLERDKTHSITLAKEYSRHFLYEEAVPGIAWEYEMYKKTVPGISQAELEKRIKLWSGNKNHLVTISGPESEKDLIPSEKEILTLYTAVSAEKLKPWQDEAAAKALLSETPQPGMIIKKEENKKLGLHFWTLSNGMKVVLKPTDFQNDEILFGSFSPGGYSLVSDDDYLAAITADNIWRESGAGSFSKLELDKMLAGKQLAVNPWITSLYEGFGGSSSVADLEDFFQLLHLQFKNPRLNEDAYNLVKENLIERFKNQQNTPGGQFNEAIRKLLYGDHFRNRTITTQVLQEMDLEKSREIVKQRFSDPGSFNCLFVGSFQPSDLEDLVKRYLASLPARDKKESWQDNKMYPSLKKDSTTVYFGKEEKSQVLLVFPGKFDWSVKNVLRTDALSRVLDAIFRDKIREEEGGTYSIYSSCSLEMQPASFYEFYIGFGCDPGRVKELKQKVLQIIREIKKDGFKEEYLSNVKQIMIKGRENSLKENSFWLDILESYLQKGLDFDFILKYDEIVTAFTVSDIVKQAEQMLKEDSLLEAVLYPENFKDE